MFYLLPPIDLLDMSVLFAISAILLLVTTQISSAYYGLTEFLIKKLEKAAIITSILFLITIAIQVIEILLEN